MPSRFSSRFQATGFPHLLLEYGETGIVDPATAARSIRILITRSPPVEYDEAGNAYLDEFVVRVYNHAAKGILRENLQRGITQLQVIEREGSTAQVVKTVVSLEREANGILDLRLR